MKRGTCWPLSAGTMVASVSKLMMPSLGSFGPMRGTFMTIGVSSPGLVTSKMLPMAPEWRWRPTVKPSITEPGTTRSAIGHTPFSMRIASDSGNPARRIFSAAAR